MAHGVQAIFSHRRYAVEFRAMRICMHASSCRVHSWRPLASYTFIKIKLVSRHLLLYVIYICQKSLNLLSMHSVVTSKNCKLAPFNLAYPVCLVIGVRELQSLGYKLCCCLMISSVVST